MKVAIVKDEWYPVYVLRPEPIFNDEPMSEVSQEQIQRWKDAEEAFQAAQNEMSLIFHESNQEALRKLYGHSA